MKLLQAIWGFIEILLLRQPMPEPIVENSVLLRDAARSVLGKDASPLNRAPQELSCAEGLSMIINSLFPEFPIVISTIDLFTELKKSPRFVAVLDPNEGTVVVSPRKGDIPGHCGVYTQMNTIASNDSRTGLFQENYTRESWKKVFIQGRDLKGYLFAVR